MPTAKPICGATGGRAARNGQEQTLRSVNLLGITLIHYIQRFIIFQGIIKVSGTLSNERYCLQQLVSFHETQTE